MGITIDTVRSYLQTVYSSLPKHWDTSMNGDTR